MNKDYMISRDKTLLQSDKICALMKQTYWASKRPQETILKSIEDSLCFGIYFNGIQVGFARVVTDYATVYYLCDVIIDEAHRGHGLGKMLIEAVVNDQDLINLSGILATKDAHGLYERYGFIKDAEKFMAKRKS